MQTHKSPTRVAICDDHAVVRKGLVSILAAAGDIEVVGEASGYADLMQLLHKTPCNVVLLDIEMPGRNGIDTLGVIRREFSGLGVLILSIYPEDQYAVRALKSGASGYLNKNSAPEQLVEAVRAIAAGRRFISPEVSEALAQVVTGHGEEAAHSRLSDREFEVMKMIAAGKRLSEIAEALALSPKTVSVYRARVLEKMHLGNNVDVARYAVEHRLV